MRRIKLTPDEQYLLTKYRKFYVELDAGKRRATTPEQVHFVDVCRGRAEAATRHEKAYMKWRELSRRHEHERRSAEIAKQAHSQAKQHAKRAAASAVRERNTLTALKEKAVQEKYDPEWKRYIQEPWGSREDWKKDKAQNWRRSIKCEKG